MNKATVTDLSQCNYTVTVDQDTDAASSTMPDRFTIIPSIKSIRPIEFDLRCEYTLYAHQLEFIKTVLLSWVRSEQAFNARLKTNEKNEIVNLFQSLNIISIPGHLTEINEICQQKNIASFTRFLGVIGQLYMTAHAQALAAMRGRYFWYLITMQSLYNVNFTVKDVYDCAKYFEWVYLIPLYQMSQPNLDPYMVSATSGELRSKYSV